MASEIKPDALCFVVRNVSHHPCIEADLGKAVTVGRREMVPELTFGPGILGIGFVPAWSIKSGPERCPHCLGMRSHYLEADLQAIDGPGQRKDVPVEKWVGVDLAAGVKGDPFEIWRRMLEALR